MPVLGQESDMAEEEYKKLLRELLAWLNSEEVKTTMSMAWVHGYRVPPSFSKRSGAMWERVKKAAE